MSGTHDMSTSLLAGPLVPLLGTGVGLCMWLSPLPAVLQARKKKYLGSLNPLPFGITLLNCFAWSLYAIMQKDIYVFITNFPGFVLGLLYSISSLTLLANGKGNSDATTYYRLETMILVGSVYYGSISMYIGFILGEDDKQFASSLVAWSGITCAVLYYAAPCTTIAQIIKTKNSSSLHPPMILANATNATLWLIYGYFGINDMYIYGPNLLGVIFAFFQLFLVTIYRSTSPKEDNKSVEESY